MEKHRFITGQVLVLVREYPDAKTRNYERILRTLKKRITLSWPEVCRLLNNKGRGMLALMNSRRPCHEI